MTTRAWALQDHPLGLCLQLSGQLRAPWFTTPQTAAPPQQLQGGPPTQAEVHGIHHGVSQQESDSGRGLPLPLDLPRPEGTAQPQQTAGRSRVHAHYL